MRRIAVTFIKDSEIVLISQHPPDHYVDHTGLGIADYKKRIQHPNKNSANAFNPINDIIDEEIDTFSKPTTLGQSEDSKAFGFRTPKKMKNLTDKIESLDIKTTTYSPKGARLPLSPLARTPNTPKTPTRSVRTPKNVQTLTKTPTSKKSARKSLMGVSTKAETPRTPYSLRAKIKQRITDIVMEDESDIEVDSEEELYRPSEEDEYMSTDEDVDINFSSETSSKKVLKRTPRTPLRTPRRGRISKVDVDMTSSSSQYFEINSNKNATSDHTLSNLQTPRLGPEALKSLLEGVHKTHEIERQELFEDHSTLFPHWMTVMSEGFSVFLCGIGSKKDLLSTFQTQYLSDVDHVVINGFFPSLTLRSVLSTIIEEIMDVGSHPQSLNDQMTIVGGHFNSKRDVDPLVLVVHNLDGPMLRNEKSQATLSQLAAFKNIHMIASLDHINAALLFDSNKYSSYNPLWWDATTLAPYSEETSYENSLMVQQSGALVLSSLIHVFQSLTPNAKGIFLILAKHQLSEKHNSNYNGFSFNDLYQRCRESFLVNSDLTLRAQLTEFKDHKLIRTKKGLDGQENLIIPLNASTLQEFLDQQDDEAA